MCLDEQGEMTHVSLPFYWISGFSVGREVSYKLAIIQVESAVSRPGGAARLAAQDGRAQVVQATLRPYHTGGWLTYCIVATAMPLRQHQGRFRPAAGVPYKLIS
jgi:hypothetical protein